MDIREDRVIRTLVKKLQRLDTVCAGIGCDTDERELADEHLAIYRVIINHENAKPGLDRSRCYLRRLCITLEKLMDRGIQRERSARPTSP